MKFQKQQNGMMWKSSPCNTIGDGDVNFDVGNDAHVAVNNLSWQGY